ncbi:choice-of-anchor L domain-containing protein [Polyangium aurulentum]|uniref:choice-of-anchor L domain-containing protein n=1 Tax=Polyangium aurulentum TaxID=2567896 RepID=UPI0010AE4E00|nr:choice-of-anchor L domain-containing protein [Polyangium aurulentum]UQA62367.1 choice-of-anchor L domain-containing protein [Polyangium aurulentum]
MKRLRSSAWIGLVGLFVGAAVAAGACAAGHNPPPAGTGNAGGGGTGGAGGAGTGGTGEGGVNLTSSSSGTGGGDVCDPGSVDKDNDADGFTEAQGDCNDCNKFVNPSAVEVIAEPDEDGGVPVPSDEDCSGKADDLTPACDEGLVLDSADAMDAAKAIGLCKFVKKATWTMADGTPPPVDPTKLANFHLGHGILPKFGLNNKPQEGARMLMLSSGTAREKGDPQSVERTFEKGYSSNAPFGFPKPSPACPNELPGKPFDATGVQFEIQVPANALSLSFDFQFFSYEWPDNICKAYNDFFNAIVEPFPMGQSDGNIAFDVMGNAISVNSGFFDACGCPGNPPGACKVPPGLPTVATFACSLGKTALVGTPFEKDEGNFNWTNGSTGWLRTTTPVTPGTNFRIRFVTYDSTDGKVDSTTLIDNWRWSGKPGSTETEVIVPK